MNDLFSKICLGVIAASLATLAYIELASYRIQAQLAPQQVVHSQASNCTKMQTELESTLSALQEQIKNVPAMVRETDNDGNVTAEYPNRLYEQLMQQIIEIRTQQDALKGECPA